MKSRVLKPKNYKSVDEIIAIENNRFNNDMKLLYSLHSMNDSLQERLVVVNHMMTRKSVEQSSSESESVNSEQSSELTGFSDPRIDKTTLKRLRESWKHKLDSLDRAIETKSQRTIASSSSEDDEESSSDYIELSSEDE